MLELDNSIIEKLEKIDKKALACSVGIMLMSWAALPIVYWLIIKKKKLKEKEDKNKKENE